MKEITWSDTIVAEVRNQKSLRVDDDDVVGLNCVNSFQAANFLWPRKVQIFRDHNRAEVHGELVTPHGEPFDVAESFALRQRKRDVLVAISLQHSVTAPLISNANAALICWCPRVTNVEISGRAFAIIREAFDEKSSRVDGKNIAGHCVMQLRQAADVCAVIFLSSAKMNCWELII